MLFACEDVTRRCTHLNKRLAHCFSRSTMKMQRASGLSRLVPTTTHASRGKTPQAKSWRSFSMMTVRAVQARPLMVVDGGSPSSCQIREGYLSRMLNFQEYKAWRTGPRASRQVEADYTTQGNREIGQMGAGSPNLCGGLTLGSGPVMLSHRRVCVLLALLDKLRM